MQVFDPAFADAQPYDVLDATKIIPEEDVPLTIVGRLVLDRWPDNFFAETEQVGSSRRTSFRESIFPTIRFCKDGSFRTWTRRNRGLEPRISTRSLSTHRSAPSRIFSATG